MLTADATIVPLQDFLKNNRGIYDGSDLPEPYMSDLYDRIINDEIKMKVRPSSLSEVLCWPAVFTPPTPLAASAPYW